MGDIAPQVPLAIGAVRFRLVRAVHDSGPGLRQHLLSEGIRLVCLVEVECAHVLKEID
jgi:hypothetical protein